MYDQSLVVQSELASIGIKTKLEILEGPLLVERLFSGKFQMISYGMSARPGPAIAFDNLKNTGVQKQYPRFPEILDEATKTMDYEKRKRLFEEAHGLVYAGVPTIICFNYNIYNGYWNHVKGFKIWATNQPRFWGVWSDK
jgi:ABC-type transport system substrate-binding protein